MIRLWVWREYTARHYLPRAAAYGKRAAGQAALGGPLLQWQRALARRGAKAHFESVQGEIVGDHHVFQAQVYLNELVPKAVWVDSMF